NPQCVIKHLKPSGNHCKQWHFSQRLFANEVESLEKLGNHDQIPKLIDCFDDNQGFYLVQELIVGEPLLGELPIGKNFGKPWSKAQCVELLNEVLDILEFIHRQGVIHGDLKPSNLLRRTSDGRLVLIDFGRAYQIPLTTGKQQVISRQPPIPPRTRCPLGYIPPEQLYGHPCPNSDLYALGIIIIQALTGLNPAQLKINPHTGEISWQQYVSVSDPIACVLNNMVRQNVKDRYQCASDVRIVLNRLAIRSEEQRMREEESSKRFNFNSPSDLQPPIVPTGAEPLERYMHAVSHLENSNSSLAGQKNANISEASPLAKSDELQAHPVQESSTQAVSQKQVTESAQETESRDTIGKWYYAREIAIACLPKLPPLMKRVSAGMATSNALAISFGLYSLWYSPPSNPGLELLIRATEHYQTGNIEKAIALAQSIPTDSSVYQESLVTTQKWRREWNIAATQFKAVEQAFNEGRWRDVLEEAHKTPNVAYWQKKIEPFIEQAIPEIELEAQQLLQKAYQRASLKDFTGALSLIEQIPPETPTGATIQPKLIEYRQKQQIKAESLLQKAYQQAAARDFKSALEHLSQIPKGTPTYQQAQVKIAEYSQKQNVKEEAQRQALLASNLRGEEAKPSQLSQRPKSSKRSKNLNPGNHLRETSPQPARR
ncbi:MAG: serine/threonine protein kinase, partial [Coleofasciculus sp. S288]|nr:serine/threonine protein kinase [Coleofasciculus sp. S288]